MGQYSRLIWIVVILVVTLIHNIKSSFPTRILQQQVEQLQINNSEIQLPNNGSYRIWKGRDAPKGRYRYMVSICDRNKGIHLCGGSLVSSQWVLTAAHCLHEMKAMNGDEQKFDPILYVGLHSKQDSDFETHSIKTHLIYPDFDVTNADGDVALLQLSHETKIPPIALVQNEDFLQKGTDLMVMGWGRTHQRSRADILQHVEMEVVEVEECNKLWEGAVLDSMFCAGGGAYDACDGDSGGPILYNGDDSTQDLQIGIVSWGKSKSCGEVGRPGVYTNIGYGAIRDWINATITPNTSILQPALKAVTDPMAMSKLNGLRTVTIGAPLPNQRIRQCVQTQFGQDCTDAPGFDTVEIEGYTIYPGKDLGDLYNYKCANTLWQNGCLVDGDAQQLAQICNEDIMCSGFVHLPQGYGQRAVPTGFLKSGIIYLNSMIPSNWTAVYLKQTEELEAGGMSNLEQQQQQQQQSQQQQQLQIQNTPVRTYLYFDWRDLPENYDYWCSGTESQQGQAQCKLSGSLQYCVERCDVDPMCDALVFLPADTVRQIPQETVQKAYRNLSSSSTINAVLQGICTLKQGPINLQEMLYNPGKELFIAI